LPTARAPLVCALLGATLGLYGEAHALDFKVGQERLRLDITESMLLAYHGNNGNADKTDDNYGELINKLNVQLAWKRFLFSVRFDSGAWVDSPSPDELSKQKDGDDRFRPGNDTRPSRGALPLGSVAFYLEKISASYSGRDVEFTLGDFYVNLGRGLVLSIRKIDELGIDTTVTGGKLLVHTGSVSAIAMAGFTNVQNLDQTKAQWIWEPNDFLAAGNVSYRILKKATLGANFMWGVPGCKRGKACFPSGFDHDYYLRPGLMLDAPRISKYFGFYAEYVRQQDKQNGFVGGQLDKAGANGCPSCNGNALYGSANAYIGRVTLGLELKWYDNFLPWHAANDPFGNLVYQVPPTLERITVQINNNTDIVAARLSGGLRVSDSINLNVSGQVARSHPSGTTDTLLDLFAGAEFRFNHGKSFIFPLIELRNEHREGTPGSLPGTEERLIAFEWDAGHDLGHRFSLESQGVIWLRQKDDGLAPADWCSRLDNNNRVRWCEGNVYLSLKWASKLSATVGYEFTTSEQEVHNTHDFLNGSVQWNITPSTSVSLFGGGQRPGLKCISGVCRIFPAFQGARLDLVVRL
jgi:hypothetical protein